MWTESPPKIEPRKRKSFGNCEQCRSPYRLNILRGLGRAHYCCCLLLIRGTSRSLYLKGPGFSGASCQPAADCNRPVASSAENAHGRGLSQNRKARRHCSERKFGGNDPICGRFRQRDRQTEGGRIGK